MAIGKVPLEHPFTFTVSTNFLQALHFFKYELTQLSKTHSIEVFFIRLLKQALHLRLHYFVRSSFLQKEPLESSLNYGPHQHKNINPKVAPFVVVNIQSPTPPATNSAWQQDTNTSPEAVGGFQRS